MPREQVRSKQIPEISCSLSHEQCASNGVYFRVTALVVNKYFCVSRCAHAKKIEKLKIWQRQILSRFFVGPNKFCQSSASRPYLPLCLQGWSRNYRSDSCPSSCVFSTGEDYLASMMHIFNETKMANEPRWRPV